MTPDVQLALETLRAGEEPARRRVVDALAASGAPEAVAPLLLAVSDDSWAVRTAATDHLIRFPSDVLLPLLEAALRDEADAGLRNAAMEIYVKLGAAASAPLFALLQDPDEEIRNFAVVMLGMLREPRAVAPLVEKLRDPDVNVRHAAALSLGQLGAIEAVPALVATLDGDPWLQYPAIHALGQIGDARAGEALLPLLGDEALRGAVLEALARIGGRDALPRVVPLLYEADPALRNLAIQATVAIEQRATADGESLDPQVQAALRRDDLVDHLLGMLADEDLGVSRTAAITLGWLREPRAEAPLVELLAQPELHEHVTHALVAIGCRDLAVYRAALEHPADEVRQGALRCLTWIAPPGAIELVAPLIHDPSPEVRAEALLAIGRLGDEDAAMLLFELLGDESELIQESAMAALAQLAPGRVAPLLVQALASPDEKVRERAAETLGLLRDSERATALVPLARDASEGVRRAAIRALGELDAPGIPDLLRAALDDASGVVRQQAALSLAKQGEPESVDVLLPLLDDPDPKMRFVAMRALGQLRSADAVPRLIGFLGDRTKELRFAAVEALSAIRSPAAVRPLMGLLGDADRNLRRVVAEALGAVGDPQALPALLLALEDAHWSVRCAAATALGRLRSPKGVAGLLARLTDDDATVRRAVVAALGELGDARAAGALVERLADPALQMTALEALRRLGAPALPQIERFFPQAGVEARRLLVDLVQRLEDRRAHRLLLAALADDSAAVRAEAALALGEAGTLDAVRPLTDLKARDPAAEVRRAAAQALKKLAPR